MRYSLFSTILFSLLLMVSCGPKNQSGINSKKLTKIDSVRYYYEYINNAELEICDSDYSQALSYYNKAFQYRESPFPSDVFNSIVLNIDLNKYEDAFKLCNQLIEYGVNQEFFNQRLFDKMKSDSLSWNNFIQKFDKYHKKYLQKTNFELKKEIHNLLASDQKNFCNKDPVSGAIPNILMQDTVFDRVYDILTEYGYPNYNLIGVNIDNDTVLVGQDINTIIQHYYQENYKDLDDLSSILLKEVYKGKLLPANFMKWDEFRFEPYHHYGKFLIIKPLYKDDLYFFKINMDSTRIAKFNENRKDIFLFPVEDAIKKIIFKVKNPNSKFIFINYGLVQYNNFPYQLVGKAFEKVNLDDYKSTGS